MTAKTTKATKTKKAEVIESPDPKMVEAEYQPTVVQAKAMMIRNKDEHAVGLLMLKDIALAETRVKDLFDEPKRLAHAAHKAITEAEKKLLVPLAEARNAVTRQCLLFMAEEKKKAAVEAQRLQEEARKREEEQQLCDAVAAEEAGDAAGAETIMAAPIAVPVIEVKPQVAEMAGVSTRVYYRCKVVNLLELVKYVAANPHEIALLEPAETMLRKRAESMRDGFRLPGCELDKKDGLSVSGL